MPFDILDPEDARSLRWCVSVRSKFCDDDSSFETVPGGLQMARLGASPFSLR